MDKIARAIARLFEKPNIRIVFWYDTKKELRQAYESLALTGVEKVEIRNNEYGIKYRILREQPDQKFLLYYEGPQPEDLNNWLLDVQLAQGTFNADQVSLWMAELGFSPSFWELMQEHAEFFKSEPRRILLKGRLEPDDSHDSVRVKMLSVCLGSDVESRIETILEALLDEAAHEGHEKLDLIRLCNLDNFLWKRLEVHFGYKSTIPGPRDFSIDLFNSAFQLSLAESAPLAQQVAPPLNQDALIFLRRWKDSRRYHEAFEFFSEECAGLLGIERDLQNRDSRTLLDIDYFRLIDQKILSDLAQQIAERTLTPGECANRIWRRRSTYWFGAFRNIYEALYAASQFIAELDHSVLQMDSLEDGVHKYQTTWYRIDQLYREFIYHVRASKQTTLLAKLIELVENLYSNNYLLKVNDNWQQIVDSIQVWSVKPVVSQSQFFEQYIGEYSNSKNKVAVIISDALRYEMGVDLAKRIQEEDRFTADIEPMVTMLPSYTQLGMAALLPHSEITVLEDGSAQVDGQSATGKENRSKILNKTVKEGAAAIRSSDLLNMGKEESRELVKSNQVIYVYHNQIDAVGDKLETEDRVFDAAEQAMQEVIDILKKLTNANMTNVIITSDHGFIYQNRPLAESEFAVEDAKGEGIYIRHRRFVIGKGLEPNRSMKQFTARELGLAGDFQVMILKSINRLRQQGSGSRYVHGGASLQEVIIPLIKVNKKRTSDVALVDVDVITSSSSIITSGQLSISFYQTEPVSGKLQPRQLRAGIYSKDGDVLSDVHTMTFDFQSENPREREVRQQFILSRKADEVNNQTVYLKLEEPVKGTSHFKEYKTFTYQLRRSFTSDFDF